MSLLYIDKQQRFLLFIVISIQVSHTVRGCRDSKRPRHGCDDCLRKQAGKGIFFPVLIRQQDDNLPTKSMSAPRYPVGRM